MMSLDAAETHARAVTRTDTLPYDPPADAEVIEISSDEEKPDPVPARVTKKARKAPTATRSTHIRAFTLLTLTHADQRSAVTMDVIAERLNKKFDIVKIVACQESHEEGGFHYHFAIHSNDISKNTGTSKLRQLIPEFDGRSIDVKFHKSWVTMLLYVTKEDPDWTKNIWGEYSKTDAESDMKARTNKTSMAINAVRAHIDGGGTAYQLARNDDVARFMLCSASSVMKFAECIQRSKPSKGTIDSIHELAADVDIFAARPKFTKDQLDALKQFASQLTGRKHRQQQLYCVGPPGTGKSFMWEELSRNTRCFVPCLENNERAFADYSDELHDWIFINDFHDNIKFQILNNLLEGSVMRLNGYGGQLTKTRNVPIVLTANRIPVYKNLDETRLEALLSRLLILDFSDKPDPDTPTTIQDICAMIAYHFL